jgi:transposase
MIDDLNQPNGVRLDVQLRPRRNNRAISSCCAQRGSTYDTQPARRFEFVPMWGIAVMLVYAMRRVRCPHCEGISVEWVPWAPPGSKRPLTLAYACFLAGWAKHLSWQMTANRFNASWDCVYQSVKQVVAYGLQHRDLQGIDAIGVDEVQYKTGHTYLTLVYQISENCRRLLYISEGRSVKSLLGFFVMLKRARINYAESIHYVCSDMWRAYLKVIAKKLPGAIHILDRFHLVATLNKAVDEVRASEAKRLKAEGYEPHLHKTRWCFLKRKANLTTKQRLRLGDVLKYDLKAVRAYLLKESFQALWAYTSPTWAGKFLDTWCHAAMRSRLDPIKKVARSLRKHRQLILNWFVAQKQFNSGIVEGLNANIKLALRKAYGFRTFEAVEVALYHQLGKLPEPPLTHRFF